ncbi:MAG: glycosyltransferase [candidate division KSB1 bacterium]|nr:glycosyltransferase [candidate division KSB1 bacterium]MDZ7336306.1 glycosyltransferase [candidate division KSB1 bacterium]MDZ7375486.1 glycosyltransferase [candidate division KSB1 bacterium]MDZ7398943.1 glycosyltransferase [candidate division KSB1 bacterium]
MASRRNPKRYSVSIIIPARNEERTIGVCLASLLAQDYPQDLIEIIVIDDDSSDRTDQVVESFSNLYPSIRMIKMGPSPVGISPKKRALQVGIEASTGELILTTDADCWAEPQWVSQMISHFNEDVGMVIGYVGIAKRSEQNLFHKLQSLELVGLTMAGLGSLGAGDPIIANGASLAMRRVTFEQVGGYDGQIHILSGDDDLLLQKIDRMTHWTIRACLSYGSFVFTWPINSLSEFIQQRTRWASKSLVYQKPSLILFLIATYLLYLWLFISIPVAFAISSFFPIVPLIVKLGVDLILIMKSTEFVGRKDLRKYFLLAEVAQIPYILYVGVAGLFNKFEWKGR